MNRNRQSQLIHSCLLVRPTGERESEPRMSRQISIWLYANRTFHPTAALFVDGKCRHAGSLPDEAIHRIEGEHQ